MARNNPTCEQIRETAGAETDPSSSGALSAHARGCAECEWWLADMRVLHRGLRALAPMAPPRGFRRDLVRRLERSDQESPWSWMRVRRPIAVGALAALAALVWALAPLDPAPAALTPHHGVVVTLAAAPSERPEVIDIEIELPAGVSIASTDAALASARVLRWRQRLGPGGFRHDVGLVAGQVGDCSILLRARAGEQWTTIRMPLHVSEEAVEIGSSIVTMAPGATDHSVLADLLTVAARSRPGV